MLDQGNFGVCTWDPGTRRVSLVLESLDLKFFSVRIIAEFSFVIISRHSVMRIFMTDAHFHD